MTYFEEEEKANSLKNAQKSTLQFDKIDTGDFQFHNFEENPVFVGKFKSHWREGERPVKGIEMQEYPSGERVILSENYRLMDFFVMNQDSSVDYRNGVFQITYKGKKELSKGGTTLSLFDIAVAYPNGKSVPTTAYKPPFDEENGVEDDSE